AVGRGGRATPRKAAVDVREASTDCEQRDRAAVPRDAVRRTGLPAGGLRSYGSEVQGRAVAALDTDRGVVALLGHGSPGRLDLRVQQPRICATRHVDRERHRQVAGDHAAPGLDPGRRTGPGSGPGPRAATSAGRDRPYPDL